MIDLDELRSAIRVMTRKQQLYKVLRDELTALGYWRSLPRGNPKKSVGVSDSIRPPNWKAISRWVRSMRGNRCEECGQEGNIKSDGKLNTISVHHLDFDAQNCNMDNLEVLCTSCHWKRHRKRAGWQRIEDRPAVDVLPSV